VFGTFLQASNLVSYWLEDFADCAPTAERNDQLAPITCSKPINFCYELMLWLVIVDKNTPHVLSSQPYLALNARIV